MVAMRRSLLAGLMVAVVVLAGACSPPEPGSHEWLIGTWQIINPDVRERQLVITFNADGTGLTIDNQLTEGFRYTLVGTQLTVIELRENGETKRTSKWVLSALTPMSFDMAMPDGSRKVTATRREL